MAEWAKAVTQAKLAITSEEQLELVLLGVMCWECLVNSPFDLSFMSRRKSWKWPTAVYWLAKWTSLLFILLANLKGFRDTSGCHARSVVTSLAGGIGMASASSLFILQAKTLWGWDRPTFIPLLFLHAGQWAIALHQGITGPRMCGVTNNVSWPWIFSQYITSVVVDFFVLLLVCIALYQYRIKAKSKPYQILFFEGASHVLLAFLLCMACTIAAAVTHNITDTYMVFETAVVFSTIAACRWFVRDSESDDLAKTVYSQRGPLSNIRLPRPPPRVTVIKSAHHDADSAIATPKFDMHSVSALATPGGAAASWGDAI